MCLLTFYPEDVQPDCDTLLDGAYVNNDGHGFAIVIGDTIMVRKGLNPDTMVARFDRARRRYPAGPALFHSRLSTSGAAGRTNCHPFRVGGDARTVLAHNGILPKKARPVGADRRCDTRITAEDLIPSKRIGSLFTRRGRHALERWMTRANKMVVLSVDPRLHQNAVILNQDAGIWDGGIWYSNLDFRHPMITWSGTNGGWLWPETCQECSALAAVDPRTGYCSHCGACQDCGSPIDDGCLCYAPARLDRQPAATC